jgi:glucose/arabinose dehydrogenase
MDQEPHTSRFYVGDVGTSDYEEIDDASTPANFGWPSHEGFTNSPQVSNYRNPVYAYPHSGSRAAITGLAFYHYHAFKYPPRFEGSCIFSDYARGWVKALLQNKVTIETMINTGLTYPSGPIDLAVWDREVYMVVLDGSIKRLSYY